MEQPSQEKKRGGFGRVLLILLLVLLLLVGAVFLYLSLGFPITSPEELAASAPMPFKERYAFHASERTVDIAVDETDLAWLMTEQADLTEALAEVERQIAPYGLSLSKYGMQFENGKALVSAKLLWYGFAPLPIRAQFTVSNSGTRVLATLEKVELGRWIALYPEALRIPQEIRVFELELSDVHSRLEQLKSARIEGDRLILTCGVGKEVVLEELKNFDIVNRATDFLGDFEATAIARALLGDATADYGPLQAMLTVCEKDPAYFVTFKRSELAIAEDFAASLYFSNADSDMLERFMPELTLESVEALDAEYDAELARREAQLLTVARSLQALNEARQLASDGKQLLNLEQDKTPLTLAQLFGGADLTEWLTLDGVRFVYGTNCSEYMTFRLERISKMPKAAGNAFSGMEANQKYAPVIMLRTATGRPALAFDATGAGIFLRRLDEDTYMEYLQSERIPVADLDVSALQ